MKKCSYCDRTGDMSREHIFAECVERVIHPDRKSVIAFDPSIPGTFHGGDFTIKDVCQACNNLHLSELDSAAKLFAEFAVKWSISDRTATYAIPKYEELLRWFLKVGYNWSRAHDIPFRDALANYREFILTGDGVVPSVSISGGILRPPNYDGTPDNEYLAVNGPGIVPAIRKKSFGVSFIVSIAGTVTFIAIPSGNRRERRDKLQEALKLSYFSELGKLTADQTLWTLPLLEIDYEEFHKNVVAPSYLDDYTSFIERIPRYSPND